MKKNIKLKVVLMIMSCFLYSQVVLADAAVVNAIRTMDANVTGAIQSNEALLSDIQTQIVNLQNMNIIGSESELSVLDRKINAYVKDYYSIFTPESWLSLDVKPATGNFTSEFYTMNKNLKSKLKDIMARDLGYNFKRSSDGKSDDKLKLLMLPLEEGANNLMYLERKPSKTASPLGPLADSKDSPRSPQIPSIVDLLGPDGYSSDDKKKAEMFIRYVFEMTPPIKTIYIPPADDKHTKPDPNNRDNRVLYLRLPKASGDKSYTSVKVQTFPFNQVSSITGADVSEYTKMVEYLSNEPIYFQPYKLVVRSANILRTLFLNSFMVPYQERVKSSPTSKSLAEREKESVMSGLDKEYYKKLRDKTTAEVNLEMLYAINKLTYFVSKIHDDNVRNNLIMAVSGLNLLSNYSLDEKQYLVPIMSLIENKCWAPTDETKDKCKNPMVDKSAMGL